MTQLADSDVEMVGESETQVYDPDQDPEEKRDVRKRYRAMQKTIEGVFLESNKTQAAT